MKSLTNIFFVNVRNKRFRSDSRRQKPAAVFILRIEKTTLFWYTVFGIN